ncbi:YjjG family noncanonical pyrimidine nucleotidase [Streptobacillus moniliformis]|uniref:YjjG family noncanonical pyrimidine nucleotidase n=1 Tax=Streptobacillus moniliformis TaxID=34105 RepID=UPI0007E305E1|nr:YjjG family noncanonical pyrimidine nucleotidase [Streptobacillus moniliformis]
MYKILLFDLDNTLLDFNQSEENALNEFLIEEGVDNIEEFKEIYKMENKKLWEKLEKNLISSEELINTRFSLVFNRFGIKKDGKEMSEKYSKMIGKQGIEIKGASNFLEKIYKKYEIYAATNGLKEIQNNRLNNSKIKKYIKKVYISQEIGSSKPSKNFFESIEKDLGFNKKEVLMIGDSLSADILGANNYGIDSIWFNYMKKENNSNVKPTYFASNFEDILKILNDCM